jgi:hypothetical protein
MKEQGRGRILVVSSVNGDVAAVPTVALYSATKAFEKSLALSMAKEMEPYGVGVSCLIPGAVRGTSFKAQSKTDEALCWKIPFYPLSPGKVAHQAVRGLLDGDVEITPGWMNRAFLKMAKPMLPQRIHNMVAELAWNPLTIHWPRFRRQSAATSSGFIKTKLHDNSFKSQEEPQQQQQQQSRHFPTNFNLVSPPRLLEMEEDEPKLQTEEDDLLSSEDESLSESSTDRSKPEPEPEVSSESSHDDYKAPSEDSSPARMDEDELFHTSDGDSDRLMMMD